MSSGSHEGHPLWPRCWSLRFVALTFVVLSYGSMYSQTTTTGAVTGVSFDSSGAVLPGVFFHLTKEDGSEEKSATSDNYGRFVLFLKPGIYKLQASKRGFKTCESTGHLCSRNRDASARTSSRACHPGRTDAGFGRSIDGSTRYLSTGKSGEPRHGEGKLHVSLRTKR